MNRIEELKAICANPKAAPKAKRCINALGNVVSGLK